MNRKSLFFLCSLLFLLITVNLSAQQTAIYRDADLDLKEGIELYHLKQYGAAKVRFTSYLNRTAGLEATSRGDAAFYQAMCAIRLNQNSGEALVERFVKDNPESPKANLARFEMGKLLFQEKKYRRAMRWFQQVKPATLSRDLVQEFNFFNGYCLFDQKDYTEASIWFAQVQSEPGAYQDAARYYYHYALYMNQEYDTALRGFGELVDNKEFGESARYNMAQIHYLNGNWEEAISLASGLVDGGTSEQQTEMSRILGDSYFRMGRYAEAVPYFERYRKGTRAMTLSEHYALGYSYFQTDQLKDAVSELELASGGEDQLAQSANHLLGTVLIRLDDKMRARSALSKAASLRFDAGIREQALFSYAKLSAELSLPNEALLSFKEFLEAFPESKNRGEAFEQMVGILASSRNYQEALEIMDQMPSKSAEVRRTYQRIAYLRALELFNNLKYREAIDLFDRSLEYGSYDRSTRALCFYWQGEAWYNLKGYPRAIAAFEKFLNEPSVRALPEYGRALYGIAYSWFSQDTGAGYDRAITFFHRFTQTPGQEEKLLADAFNRMGDSYFMKRNYQQAIAQYDIATTYRTDETPYAMFQKGFSQGLLQQLTAKIETLKRLVREYPKSQYTDDAEFEIGRAFIDLHDPAEAIQTFHAIIEKYPNSSYVRKSYLQLGLVHYNANRNSEALKMYQKVVTTWPDTQEASSALAGIRTIHMDESRVDDYFAYMESIGKNTSVSVAGQDSLVYLAAENLFMQGDCNRATESLSRYINRFPQGNFIVQAHYYKADCSYRTNKMDEALASYEFIINRGTSDFTEQSLVRASEILYEKSEFDKALKYYRQLSEIAQSDTDLITARMGLVRCLYLTGDLAGTITEATTLLSMSNLPVEVVREGTFRLGKAYVETGETDLAFKTLESVASDVKNAEGAEAKYWRADILFRKGNVAEAEKEVLNFLELGTSHRYWLARAYILWSDIFVTKEDLFQARATLEILKETYTETDDGIITMVDEKLKLINNQEN